MDKSSAVNSLPCMQDPRCLSLYLEVGWILFLEATGVRWCSQMPEDPKQRKLYNLSADCAVEKWLHDLPWSKSISFISKRSSQSSLLYSITSTNCLGTPWSSGPPSFLRTSQVCGSMASKSRVSSAGLQNKTLCAWISSACLWVSAARRKLSTDLHVRFRKCEGNLQLEGVAGTLDGKNLYRSAISQSLLAAWLLYMVLSFQVQEIMNARSDRRYRNDLEVEGDACDQDVGYRYQHWCAAICQVRDCYSICLQRQSWWKHHNRFYDAGN